MNHSDYSKGYQAVKQARYEQNGALYIIDGIEKREPTADELAGMQEAFDEMAYVSGRPSSPIQRINAALAYSQN